MRDQKKTKKELIAELDSLRERVNRLENQSQNSVGKSPEDDDSLELVINSLSPNICILDEGGTIIHTNTAWNIYAVEHGVKPDFLGVDYFKICKHTTGPDVTWAKQAAMGIRSVLKGKRSKFVMEYPCRFDDTELWYVMRVTSLSGGGPHRAIVSHEELTAHHQPGASIDIEGSNIEEIMDKSHEPILLLDPDSGSILDCNQASEYFYGYSRADLSKMTVFRINQLPRDEVRKWLQSVKPKEKKVYYFPHKLRNKTIREVKVNATRISYKKKSAVISIVHDITGNKGEIESILQQNIKFKSFINNTLIGIWHVDLPEEIPLNLAPEEIAARILRTGFVTDCNETIVQMWGLPSRNEVVGQPLQRIFTDMNYMIDQLSTFVQKGMRAEAQELELADHRGDIHFYRNSYFGHVEANQLQWLWGLQIDITQNRRTEIALRENEEQLKLITDTLPALVAYIDQKEVYRFANDTFRKWYKIPQDRVIGRTIQELVSKDAYPEIKNHLAKSMRGQPLSYERSRVYPDGKKRFIKAYHEPHLGKNGEVKGVVVLITDISSQRKIEQALSQERSLMRYFLDSIPDLIFYKSIEGVYQRCNSAFEQFAGKEEGSLIGLTDFDLFPKEVAEFFQEKDRQALEWNGARKNDEWVDYPDGRRVLLETLKTPVRDQDGNVLGLIGISRDITERKRAEEMKLKMAAIVHSSSDAIIGSTLDGVITNWNPAAEKIYGYSEDEILGKTLFELTPSENHAELREFMEIIPTGDAIKNYDTIHTNKALDKIFVAVTISPVLNAEGIIAGASIITRDTTEKKVADRALRQSEERFSVAFWDSPVPTTITTLQNGRFLDVNDSFLQLTNYYREEVIGRTTVDLQWWRNIEHRDEMLRRLDQSGKLKHLELVIQTKDGDERITLVSFGTIRFKNEECILSQLYDITDRKKAEQALRSSEEWLRSIVRYSSDVISILNKSGIITYESSSCELIFGFACEELTGKSLFDFIHPEDIHRVKEIFARALKDTGSKSTVQYRFLCSDKSWLDIESTITNYLDTIAIGGIVLNSRDISERKKAENELKESEQRLKILFEYAPIAYYLSSLDGTFLDGNLEAERISGWKRKDLVGKPIVESGLLPLEGISKFSEMFGQNQSGKPTGPDEINIIRKDGKKIIVEIRTFPVRINGQNLVLGMATDITDRKILQRELTQSQKMEAIGRLAGGVAHDFNNLLTVINGYSDVLMSRLEHDAETRDKAALIKQAGQRAGSLTKQLLAFSRQQIVQPRLMNLNSTVEELAKMLRRLIGEDIELTINLEPGLGHIKADPMQIEQILMNLAINARDAMPDGGKLIIETTNKSFSEEYSHQHLEIKPGEYAQMIITDTGIGMDEELLSHIFEPFFTTKQEGKGTGLGLATVYGIVKQSHGFIQTYSEPGIGTSFKVYFPIVQGSLSQTNKNTTKRSNLEGSETILIVEDEEAVRTLLSAILKEYGYHVHEAENGLDAIRLFKALKNEVNLIITDLVMPRMNGSELADHMKMSKPEIKILFMSGYTDTAIVQQEFLDSKALFIQKPFYPVEIVQKIRTILDSSKN